MKILVAVDGTENSLRVGEYAVKLAKKLEAEVYFIYVIPRITLRMPRLIATFTQLQERLHSLTPLPPCIREKIMRETFPILEKLRISAEAHGLRPEFIIAEGDPAVKIVEEVKNGRYDLIVVGYRSRSILTAFPGSVTRKILEKSQIPVLVVK